MRRLLLILTAVLGIVPIPAFAQVPPAQSPITGHVQTLTGGQIADTALKVQLVGCSGFLPHVYSYTGIVQPSFILTPDATGLITGTAWPNSELSCGSVTGSTRYTVQVITDGVPQAQPVCYQVLPNQTFNLDTASPCPSPNPPYGVPTDGNFTNLTAQSIVTQALSVAHLSSPTDVDANGLPGADAGQQITAADAQLAGAPGTISISSGTISTVPTISANRVLHVKGPINWNVQIPLQNNFAMVCDGPAAVITVGLPTTSTNPFGNGMLTSAGGSGYTVNGCTVKLADPTQAKATLFTGLPASNVYLSSNILTDVTLIATNGGPNSSQNLQFANNSVTVTNPAGSSAGGLLFFAKGVTASNNSFTGSLHGFEWWGGDSNGGWTGSDGIFVNGSYLQVNAAGNMAFNNTTCLNVQGSCVWGSMGYNITVTGGTADGCGDTCWDSEGGLQNSLTNLSAKNFGNFCGSVFFESKDVTFDNLSCEGASTNLNVQFGVKHANGTTGPNHDNVILRNSTFTCPALCQAVYSEGYQHLVIENDHFSNGLINGINFNYSLDILHDELRFDVNQTGAFTAINVPTPLGLSIVNVKDTHVIRMAPNTSADSVCMQATWQDFNQVEFYNWVEDECKGFGIDLSTTNAGANVGPTAYPRMVTNALRNYWHDGPAVHNLGVGNGSNDTYNSCSNIMDTPGSPIAAATYGVPIPDSGTCEATSGGGGGSSVTYGTTAGTATQGNDTRVVQAVQRTGDAMGGPLTLAADPASALQAATKQYVDNKTAATGSSPCTSFGTAAGTCAQGNDSRIAGAVQRSGDTMVGPLVVPTPTTSGQAANKGYVDSAALESKSQYGSIYTFGDSWTQGTGSSNGPTSSNAIGTTDCTAKAFAYGLLCDYGAPAGNNFGTGGDESADMSLKVVNDYVPTVANNPVVTMLIGTNDKNVYGPNTDQENISYRSLLHSIAWATIPALGKTMAANTTVCTQSGTWAQDGVKIYTQTAGSTLTCTVTAYSRYLYYGYVISDNYSGNHTVTIDGAAPSNDATVANTGQNGAKIATANGSAVSYALSRYILPATTTFPSTHTFVITEGSGISEPFWIGTSNYPENGAVAPPNAYVSSMSPQLGSQTATTQANYVALNDLAISTLAGDGLNVTEVYISDLTTQDFAGYTSANGTVYAPGTFQPYHPGDSGHAKIRADFEAAMRPVLRALGGGSATLPTNPTFAGATVSTTANNTAATFTAQATGNVSPAGYVISVPGADSVSLAQWATGAAGGLPGQVGLFDNVSKIFGWVSNNAGDFCTHVPYLQGGSGINVAGCSGASFVFRGDGSMQSLFATAPTGSCSVNGVWAVSQDGNLTRCLSGTWSPYTAPAAGTIYGTPTITVGAVGAAGFPSGWANDDHAFVVLIGNSNGAVNPSTNVATVTFGKAWKNSSGTTIQPACVLSGVANGAVYPIYISAESTSQLVLTTLPGTTIPTSTSNLLYAIQCGATIEQ